MASNEWDPDQYARFEALRSRPFWDLVELVDDEARIDTLVDLGCGTGALTAALAMRLDAADTVGIDASPAMLERAEDHRSDTIRFQQGDIGAWTGDDIDLIVANASLQWVPDHVAVLARWIGSLHTDGQIAVQVPANADHPSHTCARLVAHREPFLSAFDGAPPPDPVAANVLRPEQYSELLHDLGIADPDVRLQVYPQLMPSSADVVEWTSGTTLTRFFARLPQDLHDEFLDAYRHELLATIGDRSPYFYAFKRILMAGRRVR